MAREEISRSRRRRSTRHGRVWQGRKEFTCPRAEVEQHERELTFDLWAFNTAFPPMTAVGVDVDPYDPAREGNGRIVVTYDSAFDGSEFPVGRASLKVHGRGKIAKLTHGLGTGEASGALDTKPDADGEWWEPVEPDSNIVVKHNTIVTVNTAYRQGDLHWDTIGNRIGWVCDHDMPKMANAKKNTMKLIDAGIPKYVLSNPDDDIVPIQFIFERYRYGNEWPEFAKAQKWKKKALQLPVEAAEDLTDAVTGGNPYVAEDEEGKNGTGYTDVLADAKMRVVVVNVKVGDPVDRRINRFKSFSDIKALLAWRER